MRRKSLTQEQRNLVEENHNLIYTFLNKKKLDFEEYYDILALALCNASRSYNPEKYSFSTYAFSVMDKSVIDYWRALTAEKRLSDSEAVSLNKTVSQFNGDEEEKELLDYVQDNFDLEKTVISDLSYSHLLSLLTDKQKVVIEYRMQGYTEAQIGKKIGIAQKNVHKLIERARKTFDNCYN